MLQEAVGVFHSEGLSEQMAARIAAAAGARLRLFKDSLDPSADTGLADFEANEADFTGYAEAVLTWSAAGHDAEGGLASLSSRAFFQATDAVAPNSIKGAWLQQSVALGEQIMTYWVFPLAVPVNVALAYLGCVVRLRTPQVDEISVDS